MDIRDIIRTELDRDPKIASSHTRRAYFSDLERFEEWRARRPITLALVEEYLAEQLGSGKAPATVNRSLAALRWWSQCVVRDRIDLPSINQDIDPQKLYQDLLLLSKLKWIKHDPQPRGRRITPKEIQALIAACKADESILGARDLALVGLAWTTGATQSELTALHTQDLTELGGEHKEDPPGKDLQVNVNIPEGAGDNPARWQVRIVDSEGEPVRSLPLAGVILSVLTRWMEVRGTGPGFLFCSIRKGGQPEPAHRLGASAMRKILRNRAQAAGISGRLTWSDFRYTMIVDMLEDGTDPQDIQRIAGHKAISSTYRYAQSVRWSQTVRWAGEEQAEAAVVRWRGKAEQALRSSGAARGDEEAPER